ncbi:MAG: hydrogenase maturation nickel metallochaperone HypA [Gemmataceae bacterium]
MHELSIAVSIVESATAAAERAGARSVTVVRVRIGELAGVHPESLQFHFSEAVRNTLLENARLVIEPVPVALNCPACGLETELGEPLRFVCSSCGEPTGNVIRGRELEVDSIEVT